MDTLKHSLKHKLSTISAFTLVELLVVIGIISVLAVALLVSLNPTESQRRARDAARIKDAGTLQTVVEAYLNDGGPIFCTEADGCNSRNLGSTEVNNSAGQGCDDNWFENGAADPTTSTLCNYAKTIPVDPSNGQSRQCYGVNAGVPDPTDGCVFRYRFKMDTSGNYEINFMVEAEANALKAGNDGGNTAAGNGDFVQVKSNPTLNIFTNYDADGTSAM